MNKNIKLKRTLTVTTLSLYGMGTIIGAGIYVLIGKVAAVSSVSTAYAFLLSGIIAMFSALSYSELASRFPQSSGESAYVSNAFNRDCLARIVGWMVILTGIVSSATLANGFLGYLNVFVDIPSASAIICLILALTILSVWGIKESFFLITIITLL
jgi:APA family basic amino acid/polyamine antiporter